jgi:hypothetical protein
MKNIKTDLFIKYFLILISISSLCLLSACGGGGGGSSTDAGRTWGTSRLLERNSGSTYNTKIGYAADGSAIAVWIQTDGTWKSVWASHYTSLAGWSVPELIEHDDSGDAGYPRLAISANGDAVVVWSVNTGVTAYNIWANHYTSSGGWETAQTIESGAGSATFPEVAIDNQGNAMAIWSQFNGTDTNIMVNQFSPVSGWGAEQTIESMNGLATFPDIAFDPSGNAMAVWTQPSAGIVYVWSNRYVPGTTGWEGPQQVETNSSNASNARIAFDSAGNALAVWVQNNGGIHNSWANRYTPTGGWQSAQRIDNDDMSAVYSPKIIIDNNGDAIAVWSQDNGSFESIWATRYLVSSGWETAEKIQSGDTSVEAGDVNIAIGGNNHAIAVWYQSDGSLRKIWANEFIPGSGWSTPELIGDTNFAQYPDIAIDNDGNAIAVWTEYDGFEFNVMASQYN